MSGLGLAALLAVAVWLAVLSLVALLLVRQLSLVTLRLSLVAPHAPADARGPDLGAAVPPDANAMLRRDGRPTVLLLLSGTCSTCRSLAARLGPRELGEDTVVLIGGRQSLATDVAELLPSGTDVRFEPQASRIAKEIGLDAVPFGLRIDAGTVSRKAYLHGPDDVLRLRGDDYDGHSVTGLANPLRLFKSGGGNGSNGDLEVGA